MLLDILPGDRHPLTTYITTNRLGNREYGDRISGAINGNLEGIYN